MTESKTEFKEWLAAVLPLYAPDYRHFNNDLMGYSDDHKDWVCFAFLKHFPSWWDDVLPPCLLDPRYFLHYLYQETEDEELSLILRGDIYLALESTLCPIVEEVFNEVYNVQPEEFAGYEVGQ